MNWGWPQIVLVCWLLVDLGMGIEKHGKPTAAGVYRVWPMMMAVTLFLWLLYMGGFFGGRE